MNWSDLIDQTFIYIMKTKLTRHEWIHFKITTKRGDKIAKHDVERYLEDAIEITKEGEGFVASFYSHRGMERILSFLLLDIV